ncbi:MAG: alpha/beta fold hydrolase, partial [Spirochaetaceae bacterium]
MTLHYQELGSGDTLVILHGLFGSGDNWLRPARELSRDFHVILPDMPNHGDSPHGTSMQYPVMASETAAFLGEREPVHLIGHSMGGKVAMALAIDYPELVRSLIVVDICPVRYEPSHTRILEGMQAVSEEAPDRRSAADAVLAEYIPDAAVRAFLMKSYDARSARWKLNVPLIHGDYA